MNMRSVIVCLLVIGLSQVAFSQSETDSSFLTIDRIYASSEFRQEYLAPLQWMNNGNSYVRVENNENKLQELARYESATNERSVLVPNDHLIPEDRKGSIRVESFTFSKDESKILIFTNSSRVWRANTKGDYWMLDLESKKLTQIGADFEPSSLMFAKFSSDNSKVAFVHKFNVYVQDIASNEVTQLTNDGGDGIINGTFDWAYEEEFGNRDGFSWSPDGANIAFWRLDASKIGTFYMINNTDSVYSEPLPLQYPKVGQDPSKCEVGIVGIGDKQITWIPLEGSKIQNYIPSMQWLNSGELLIQQLNRHQNKLIVWKYIIASKELKKIYTETEETWVDIQYPDVSANGWGDNTLKIVDNGKSFLRLTENDGWRHLYKVNIANGSKKLLTPGDYDAASLIVTTSKYAYFHASPDNSTQRYLYRVDIKGSGKAQRLTPASISGVNVYNCSPNGKYAIQRNSTAATPTTHNLVSLPSHKVIAKLVENKAFIEKLSKIKMPEIEFTKVTTEEGMEIDVRVIKPINFDPNKKYPVFFHVYGEPWGQVATDSWVGMWNIMLAQQGYLVVDMDNRGTPCLKGSAWRKSIYRKIGDINARDQAQAAKEFLKLDYADETRTAVWGWSGGGSMTLNLMFKYPEIYKTGISVAAVSNQLIYDNIYQERYMGLPQENMDDFVNGSPITYAKNLEGNLLIIHGTGDDNVHYQGMEMLIDELVAQNKQFDIMIYPNRSHGIYEGRNTRRHLFGLITNYLMEKVPVSNSPSK